MHEAQVDELAGAAGVREADEGARHEGAEVVDHEEEVARVVEPGRVWAEVGFVEDVAGGFVGGVGDPDGADGGGGGAEEGGEEGLVEFFGEAEGVGGEEGDGVGGGWGGEGGEGRVLLYGEVEGGFLGVVGRGAVGVVPDVLAWDDVFFYLEELGGHVDGRWDFLRKKGSKRKWSGGTILVYRKCHRSMIYREDSGLYNL